MTEFSGGLENYGRSLQICHKGLRQINTMMDDLMRQIQVHNSSELKTILKDLEKIAKRYRLLEYNTLGLVTKTNMACDDVRSAAEAALQEELTALEAIQCMNQDFQGLQKSMKEILERHSDISTDLKLQAQLAREAKERNDELQQLAEERRDDAETFGIVAIPGVALLGGPVVGAKLASEAVDNAALKVLAGVGGAVGGLLGGIVTTLISPLLAGWAIRCAVLGRKWSETFTDLSDRILDVEQAIADSACHLVDINTAIGQIEEHVARCSKSTSPGLFKMHLKRIIGSCQTLTNHCEEYRASLVGKAIHQISSSRAS